MKRGMKTAGQSEPVRIEYRQIDGKSYPVSVFRRGQRSTRKVAVKTQSPAIESDYVREQNIVACRVALACYESRNDQGLNWFTYEVLKLDDPLLAPFVAMALQTTNKSTGNYGWETARNPIAYLRTVAQRKQLEYERSSPFVDNQAMDIAAAWGVCGRPGMSGSRRLNIGFSSHRSLAAEADQRQYAVDAHPSDAWLEIQASRCEGAYDDDRDYIGDKLEQLDQSLVIETKRLVKVIKLGDVEIEVDLGEHDSYDWDKIGSRLNFDQDERDFLKMKALGVSESQMSGRLLWDRQKVEKISKRVERKLLDTRTAAVATRELLVASGA